MALRRSAIAAWTASVTRITRRTFRHYFPVKRPAKNRKVAQNLPTERKCHKRPSHSNHPKRVTPKQRLREFPDQKLVVSGGKLF